MKFSKRMDLFGDEIFAALNDKKIELESQGKTLYNLSVGTPDFPIAEHIRNALIKAAGDPENWKYSLRDLPEMTQAVCDYYQKRFGVSITPDMVCSCYGSQEGIGHIGLALCDEGELVLLPTPCYPVFIAGARMAELTPWYYPMSEETHFLPDVNTIPEEIAKKARCMVISLPSNPTGSVGTPEVYQELIAFAEKYDILLIHDNAYSDIIFDGVEGKSFLSYPHAREVGVEFFSLSKSFNLTGARISFLVGRPDVVAAFRKLRSQIDFGMFIPIQKAAIAALTGPTDMVKKQCLDYQDRRDALCGGLREIGWNVRDSKGSMFVWAPVPESYRKKYEGALAAGGQVSPIPTAENSISMRFCMDLIEQAGVICTPGSSFGPMGEGFVRFALVMPPEEIKKVILAIKDSGILDA